ncbi:MAG: GTP 3',8-cyclase MoaA [Bacteroidota bacterium]
MLKDNHGRLINYVRLAVTDRCNLRCFYCMPEEGIKYVDREELLTYEEMERLVSILASKGVDKVRITGGEPFVRKGMLEFLERLAAIKGINKLNITTNGTLTAPIIGDLKRIGINSINLSLDSLNPDRFFQITRRNVFDEVMKTLHGLIENGIPTKINAVIMENQNIEDIIPMAELTKKYPIDVRFIEEMPFNGSGSHYEKLKWNYIAIIDHIKNVYPDLTKIPDQAFSTSYNYHIPGHLGNIGVIAAYSRTFCGSCNRLRVTPQGMLKTCLYDNGVFNLKTFMRSGATDQQMLDTILHAIGHRAKNGFEAEQKRMNFPINESMATIGG